MYFVSLPTSRNSETSNPFDSRSSVSLELITHGGRPVLRENFVSDNGNLILDIHNLEIMEPIKLEQTINNIPGVVTNGIFALDHANVLLCASDNGIDKTDLNA